MLIITALFTLAATTALSVDLRRRRFALLRAVGATRGQVRRAVLAEQALLAVAGGLLGYLPGTLLGALAVRALASHALLPPGSTSGLNGWFALLACAVTLPACLLSALLAARRAARTSPARAMRESHAERGGPHPVRVLLGLAAAAGVVVLAVVSLRQNGPGAEISLALPLLASGMAAVTLLGPALVAALAALLRPLAGAGPAARLTLAAIRRMPRRTASAIVPVSLAVAMIGAVAFLNTTVAHAATVQSGQAVTASYAGLDDETLAAARPGARLASRAVYSAEVAQNDNQNNFIDLLILGVIAALAAVTLVNTLVVSTVERRGRVRLLASAGATTRQLAWSFGWQALFVTLTGVASGAAVCAGTLIALSRAVTGSAAPYIPAGQAALLIGAVATLTLGAVLTPFAIMTRRGESPA